MTPVQILLKYWGYSSFRPLQEDIINSVLQGRDTLALLPTGGGKSICFQVPALAREGICIVVTPLISLMRDQVENLTRKKVKAVAIYSGMHPREREVALDNAMFGDTKFLYLSPERLGSDDFRQVLQRMKVNLIAVDEAHCISQWGYDFRPPYLRIADIRQYFPEVPVLALTATATPEVAGDIQEKLGFPVKNIFQNSFERKNLTYAVVREEDKLGRLLRILRKIDGTGIVYVRNRKRTREIANYLLKHGISADHYHAGLDARDREKKQEAWKKGVIRVIVATNAFGMGIDKPDVRSVVHMDLPDTPEAYFQEAGRGGRDGKRSYAVLLYDGADIKSAKSNFELSYPPPATIRGIYDSLGNYLQLATGSGKDQSFEFDLHRFSHYCGKNSVVVFNSLRMLEREGYLFLNEGFDAPARIMIIVGKEDLYRFQVEHRKFDPLVKLLLRSYSGLFAGFVKISEKELARRINKTEEEMVALLQYLASMGLIEYIPGKEKPEIMFVQPYTDAKNILLSKENYLDRKKEAFRRMQTMIDYVTDTTHCRSMMLLAYFGENNAQRCGTCDVCRERNKLDVNEMEFDRIIQVVKPLLLSGPMTLQELVFEMKGFPEERILSVIRWLEDNGKVVRKDRYYYQWKKQFDLNI